MSDLEAMKKEAGVTVTPIDDVPLRPVLGRRKTTTNPICSPIDAKKLAYDCQEDRLTKFGNFLSKIHQYSIITRYALYILPVAILLAVPIVLLETVFKGALHENIHLVGLFIWLEELWLILWIAKGIALLIPICFQACCGIISTGVRKYTAILIALEVPLSIFVWTIGGWWSCMVLTIPDNNKVCKYYKEPPYNLQSNPCDGWPKTVRKVFLAGIVVAAIFLAEKTVIQLIAINYHRKQYDQKIKESKKMVRLLDMLYESSRAMFHEGCKAFEEEDEAIAGNNLEEVRKKMARAGVRTKFLSDMGRARDKATAAFGSLVAEISGAKLFDSTSAHSVVIEALETDRASIALARRLWLSLAADGKDALYRHDLEVVLGHHRHEEAEEIFAALDVDNNGDVSLAEMTMLILGVAQERKNRATSIADINDALSVLDRLLSLVVVVGVVLVYGAFFSHAFSTRVTSLWATFVGLSFAVGGTVTEFLACCIFLFIKHPYDVGDRVDINDTSLIVEHVSLMYSVFRRVDSDKIVQIPHNIANSLWVENVSRSRAMKERLTLSVAAGTSNEDILALRAELLKFVGAEDNRRDFKLDFDIELLSVGNLKQLDLCVEIKYKSNWANDQLRSTRRNKFMCELLAACRRIPIDPAGGSGPSLGDPSNPSYSVAVSDLEAVNARAQHTSDVAAKRLFPKGSGASFLPEGISTALGKPAQTNGNDLTGRRESEKEGPRQSSESMTIRSTPGYPPRTFQPPPR